MSSTTIPTLPPEILYPILTHHILSPHTTPHAALSLRLISKRLNPEILHQLFTLGHIDSKYWSLNKRQSFNVSGGCQVCRGKIRPERRERAINRVTVRRYLVGWLGREIGKEDVRFKVWKRMRSAIGWVGGEGRQVTDNLGEMKGKLECTSAFSSVPESVKGKETALLNLVDATITLFGVRDTWAYLGPHHRTCRPTGPQFPKPHGEVRPAEFWCLLMAAYAGDTKTVRYLLEEEDLARTKQPSSSSAATIDGKETILNSWPTKPHRTPDWTPSVHSIAAVLTVAIRRGHHDMVTISLGMGPETIVCCDFRFWDNRTVMGTLFAATAGQNRQIAGLAVDTIKRTLLEWWTGGLWVKDRQWCIEHLRYALDIPTSAGILRGVLSSLLPGNAGVMWDEEISNRLLFHLLCQAALTNDVERAREAARAIVWDFGNTLKRHYAWTMEDAFLLRPCNVTDEYGVRSDRLLDGMNPIRIAAALSHVEILEWLLSEGWDMQKSVKPWQLKADEWRKHHALKDLALHATNNSTLLDARQEAVYDAFIDRGCLPAYVKPTADPKILEMILRKSEGLSWERETIISAGTQNADIFETFVNFVDLNKRVAQKIHHVKGPLFVDGAHAHTVGERSLQHALKAGRFDNAKILLTRGVKLAEAIRSDGFYHDDPEAMAILKGLQEMELPGLNVVSRTMQVLYWVNGDVPLRLRQTKTIEESEKGYVWKYGQKVKKIGAPTFPALETSGSPNSSRV